MQLNAIGGGAYDVIRNWCTLLKKRQFDVHVFIVSRCAKLIIEDYKQIDNINITIINIQELPWYSTLIVFKNLRDYLIKEKIEILHTVLLQADILGALAGKIAGVPILISSVLGYLVNPVPGGSTLLKIKFYKIGYSLMKNTFDRILPITKANLIELIEDFNVPKSKMQVSYCGIKLGDNSLFKFEGTKKSKYKIIGVMAELIPAKGVDIFIKAIPEITNIWPFSKFIIAGDGPQMMKLKELVKELSIERNVKFLGWVPNSREVIRQMDIFVFPSLPYYDGLPRVILEAWAVGTPVVATKVAAIPELITPDVDGVVVKPNSSLELAKGVLKLLSNSDLATLIVKNACEKIVKFDVQTEVENMEKMYISLLAKK